MSFKFNYIVIVSTDVKTVGCRLFVHHRLRVAYRLHMRIHVDVGRAATYHSATERQSDCMAPLPYKLAACCLKPYSIITA